METQQPLDVAIGRDSIDWAREYQAILRAYEQAGGSPAALRAGRVAALVVNANRVLGIINVPGSDHRCRTVAGRRAGADCCSTRGVSGPPCASLLRHASGNRRAANHCRLRDQRGAQVEFLAHCTFPNARDLQHTMEAQVHIGEGACLRYTEAHYHGPYGGVVVEACADITSLLAGNTSAHSA
jgi:hypothetical protein